MATLVNDGEGRWLVIDTLLESVVDQNAWMDKVSDFDIKRQALSQVRFYTSDARKFQPAYGDFSVNHFEIPELRSYFQDLFQSLSDPPASLPPAP